MSERIHSSGRIAVRRIGSECSSSSSRVVPKRLGPGGLPVSGIVGKRRPSAPPLPFTKQSEYLHTEYKRMHPLRSNFSYIWRAYVPSRDAVERALLQNNKYPTIQPRLKQDRQPGDCAAVSFHRCRCGLMCAKSLF